MTFDYDFNKQFSLFFKTNRFFIVISNLNHVRNYFDWFSPKIYTFGWFKLIVFLKAGEVNELTEADVNWNNVSKREQLQEELNNKGI